MSPRRVCERRSVNALTTVSWPSPTTHTYAWDQIRRLIPASPSRVSRRDERWRRLRRSRLRADGRALVRLASHVRIEERERNLAARSVDIRPRHEIPPGPRGTSGPHPTGPRAFGREPRRPATRTLFSTPNVADHRDPRLRRRACLRDPKSGRNETGDVRLAPAQCATRIRTWLCDTTELGQQRVPALRSEQPCEGLFLFGVRLAKVLERSDREHAIDEVLGSTPRSYPTCIGIPGSLVEHLVREHRWAPASDSGIGCAAHITRNRLPKWRRDPSVG